jgi:hypothetical protein
VGDRGHRSKSSQRRRIGVVDETLQIRVRRKNPLIERKATGPDHKQTRTLDKAVLFSEAESSETTQEHEIELEDVDARRQRLEQSSTKARRGGSNKQRRKSAAFVDEDATEIADQPPAGNEKTVSLRLKVEAAASRSASNTDVSMIEPPIKVSGEAKLPRRKAATDGPIASRPRASTPIYEGVVPRALLGHSASKAVGTAAARAQLETRLGQAADVAIPGLKSVAAELSLDHLSRLECILAGELEERGVEAALSPKRALEHLINEPAFNALSAAERARVFRTIAMSPSDVTTIKSSIALFKAGVVRRLDPPARIALFELFGAVDGEGRACLARMAARPLAGRAVIEDHDRDGVPLVTRLHTLVLGGSVAAPIAKAGFSNELTINRLLASLANPERLAFEEGADGVLAIVEFALATSSPAELARLWIELVAEPMRARTAGEVHVALGKRLEERPSTEFSQRETPIRLGLELLFLSELPRGQARSALLSASGASVDAELLSRVLRQLYGVGFSVAAGEATVMRQLARVGPGTNRRPPVFVSTLYDRGERVFVFERLDEGFVHLRAPHGRSSKRRGAQRADPLRTIVDPELGVDQIPLERFRDIVGFALIPRS